MMMMITSGQSVMHRSGTQVFIAVFEEKRFFTSHEIRAGKWLRKT